MAFIIARVIRLIPILRLDKSVAVFVPAIFALLADVFGAAHEGR
jgi:hypothetical protein